MDFNIIQGQCSLTNSGDVYSGTLSVGVNAYRDKGIYLCEISATNTTTTPTLNINSIGAKTIVLNNGAAVSASTLLINSWCLFMYDTSSDKFLLVSNNAGSGSSYNSYTARLFSVGTDDPTASIIYNNTGKTFEFTFQATGKYGVIPNTDFNDSSKVLIFTQLLQNLTPTGGSTIYIDYAGMPSYFEIYQYNSSLIGVNNLNIYIEIRIYN